MKRTLIALAVVGGLVVAADRVAVALAEKAVGTQLQTSAGLQSAPDVEIRGFPFLTQAFGGRYEQVRVDIRGLPTDGVRVARLEADLLDLEVPLGDAVSGAVDAVPVRAVRASALVSYDDLARTAGSRKLTVAPAGERVAVTGSLQVLGRRLTVTALSTVRVSGEAVVIRAAELRVGNALADAAVTAAVGGRLDLRVQVDDLPYGLRLDGVRVTADGVSLSAVAGPTVLTRSGLR